MKILIAEDNQPLQVLAEDLMSMWNYDFDIANNGQEAVEYAQKNEGEYDICLMDVEMPIMTGIKAAEIIRQKFKYFPIMAVSSDPYYRNECLEVGMDDFLEKPYSSNQLFAKLDELTVKSMKIDFIDNHLHISKEIPVNSEQLKELRDLDKKGLALLIIESGQQKFVVHKNIQNKMSHVLIGEGKELFEFLDRGDRPANCHLYKGNMQTNRLLLTPEQFEEQLNIENTGIEKYESVADQKFSKENKEK